MSAPWVKFFASDFLTGVADMTAEEIGAYTVILALIWDRGGPVADDPQRLARRAGVSTRRWNQLRERLIEAGKLRVENGHLTNDRAIKTLLSREEVSEKRRNSARTRWDNQPENQPDPSKSGGSMDAKAFPTRAREEARSQKLDKKEPNGSLSETGSDERKDGKPTEEGIDPKVSGKAKRGRRSYPEAFEAVWRGYPTDPNMSKAEALDAWKRLDEADRDAVRRAVPGFVAYCRKHPDYRPIHLVRFIQKRRFDGFAVPSNPTDQGGPVDWERRLNVGRDRGMWPSDRWGPPPGAEGCQVPPELIGASDHGWREWRVN